MTGETWIQPEAAVNYRSELSSTFTFLCRLFSCLSIFFSLIYRLHIATRDLEESPLIGGKINHTPVFSHKTEERYIYIYMFLIPDNITGPTTPYSPDHAPCDFHFWKKKIWLERNLVFKGSNLKGIKCGIDICFCTIYIFSILCKDFLNIFSTGAHF